VVDERGEAHRTDVIIYATGFDITGSYDRIRVEGAGGRLLEDAWRTGARTYNGIAAPGFPNMFLLLGPNSPVTYTGVVVNIETQARYVVRAIRTLRRTGARALVARPEAEQRFQEKLKPRFARTIWSIGGCRSWYLDDSPSGTVIWPDSTARYRWLLRTVHRDDFDFLTAVEGSSGDA
jgi:cation diffusion facilitator CzcD-associated flavoprotein CzcO